MTRPAPDNYAVLQIPHRASQQEVARAYRALMRRHHPDVANGEAVPANCNSSCRPSPFFGTQSAEPPTIARYFVPELPTHPPASHNPTTGAALAVVPIWSDDDRQQRTFGVFYLPSAGDIWVLHPGRTQFLEPGEPSSASLVGLRNDAFRKAVSHANEFLFGPPPLVD